MNTEQQESKSIVIFDDDPCSEWLNKENYSACCDVPKDEIEDDAYYDWVSCCLQSTWEDFKEAVKNHLDDNLCVVTGHLGLWNGSPEIEPEICCDTLEALEKCFDIRGDHYETVAIEEDGSLTVSVHHHDGCNSFTLRKVAPESEGLALCIQDYGEDDKRLQRRMHLGARQTTPPGIMFRPFNDTPDVLITYDNYYGRNVHLRSAKAVDEDEKLYRICKETLDKA